jgi:hypothetical protein
MKNCVSGRDPALRGFCKCTAHPADGGTALSKAPRALSDGPILVFQQPANAGRAGHYLADTSAKFKLLLRQYAGVIMMNQKR